MLLEILYIIFGISIFGIFWTYAGYPIFIWFLSKIIKKEHKYDENYQPNVSLMIMTYNEEKTIERKIKNAIEQNYSKEKLQILVVDSGSTDRTHEIVEKYKDKGIELIKQKERKGKGAGINFGLNFAKNDIIIITDANAYFDKNAIKHLVKHFSDSNVGIVGGKHFVKKIKSVAETEGTDFFRKYEEFLREKESIIDSAVNFGGEIFGIRKSLCTIDEKNITEDFENCLTVRKKGYRLLRDPKASAYEYAPSTKRDVFIQRKKVLVGSILTLIKHRDMLFNPKYGFYGVIILPGHRLFQVLNPFFLILIFLSSIIIYILSNNIFIFYFLLIQILFLIISIILVILSILKIELKLLPIMALNYFLLVQYSCFMAWISYFKKNYKVTWEKMESSRNI
ncbi:putative Glycosyl transferase family 2 [groundwater metagenome]|uniref:Putative Glycosyl transferase family 2 n=1 Tax=groundwater metagenome TaxID=717931 RepID=A0A098EC12_9ZZZZ